MDAHRRLGLDRGPGTTQVIATDVRSGPGYWLSSYASMLRFELGNLRAFLVLAAVIQLLMGAGMSFMYGFYLGALPPDAQAFLVSGIPALAIIPIGFVMVPGAIMQHKFQGTYDFVWSLPAPRTASAAATFSVFTALALPGSAVALWIAVVQYGVQLDVSWTIIPAVLLTSLMGTSVGFGFGHAIPNPRITNLITNLVSFLALLFSPIVVPIEQFPDWWAAVHRVLPFYHMATVIRGGLTEGLVGSVGVSYLVLIGWTLVSWLVAGLAVARRR